MRGCGWCFTYLHAVHVCVQGVVALLCPCWGCTASDFALPCAEGPLVTKGSHTAQVVHSGAKQLDCSAVDSQPDRGVIRLPLTRNIDSQQPVKQPVTQRWVQSSNTRLLAALC